MCRSVYMAGRVIRYGASIAASSAATCRHSANAWSSASPPRCRRGARGGAGEGEAAAAELVAQLFGVGGEVAEGAEFDGGVAGGGGLVEEAVPGHLLGVVGEPDAPGVGGGAEAEVGQRGMWAGWVRPRRPSSGRLLEIGNRLIDAGGARWRSGPPRGTAHADHVQVSGCCSRRSRRSCRCWWRRRTTGRSAPACRRRCRCRWSAAATASRRRGSPAGRAAGRRRTRPSCP